MVHGDGIHEVKLSDCCVECKEGLSRNKNESNDCYQDRLNGTQDFEKHDTEVSIRKSPKYERQHTKFHTIRAPQNGLLNS